MAQAATTAKTIGILGTGTVGITLARGFTKLGHTVTIGSRKAVSKDINSTEKDANKQACIKEYGLVTFEDAVKNKDIIIICVLGKFCSATIDRISKISDFSGKLIIDCCNPIKFIDAKMPLIMDRELIKEYGSLGELVQSKLPKANVVKCFNILGSMYMCNANPNGTTFDHDPSMFICGNNDDAKKIVSGFLTEFGWKDIHDVGGIDMSLHLESMCFIWCHLGFVGGVWDANWCLMRPKKQQQEQQDEQKE